MVRVPLTADEWARGAALGSALRRARGDTPVRAVATGCGVAEETIRKIERGGVPTPALFTIAKIAGYLRVPVDDLVREATQAYPADRFRPGTVETSVAGAIMRG